MKKPIELYKDILKEFGVEGNLDVHPRQKLAYIEEQIHQQQALLNRLFFDLTTANKVMNEAQDPLSKNAHLEKVNKYRNDAWQILEALKVNLTLSEELRSEYPDVSGSASV